MAIYLRGVNKKKKKELKKVKIRLLPSSIESGKEVSQQQRLTSFIVDEMLAVDAGSLGIAVNDVEREGVRDVVITHAHMDHMATLPVLLVDVLDDLTRPIRVYATATVLKVLKENIFNGKVWAPFHEIKNRHGIFSLEFVEVELNVSFKVGHLTLTPFEVTHTIDTFGLYVTDGVAEVAFTSDTGQTVEFWENINSISEKGLDGLMIECSFPDSHADLARLTRHLTPSLVVEEMKKLKVRPRLTLAVHIKPSSREQVLTELDALGVDAMEIGKTYVF